eukprot:1654489-Amphidinium_carterae.2
MERKAKERAKAMRDLPGQEQLSSFPAKEVRARCTKTAKGFRAHRLQSNVATSAVLALSAIGHMAAQCPNQAAISRGQGKRASSGKEYFLQGFVGLEQVLFVSAAELVDKTYIGNEYMLSADKKIPKVVTRRSPQVTRSTC